MKKRNASDKRCIFMTLFIGQIFIWTGSAFMTLLYRLYESYSAIPATLITEGLFMAMQAAGMLLFALFRKKKASLRGLSVTAAVAATAVFTLAALTIREKGGIVVLGCLMNLWIGMLSARCFTDIAVHIPKDRRGIVFGSAYAIGSIGTYLLSLPGDGSGLTSSRVVFFYLAMMLVSVSLTVPHRRIFPRETENLPQTEKTLPGKLSGDDARLSFRLFVLPFLCYLVYCLGDHFPATGNAGDVNAAFTRAFYSLGLIAAGLINDRSRRAGSLACFLSLVFPFISLALHGADGFATALSILSYLFLGFLSVFRVLLFTDVAAGSRALRHTASFGLMMGTLGSVTGTVAGLLLDSHPVALTLATAGLFILYGAVFFSLYPDTAFPAPKTRGPEKPAQDKLFDFRVRYALNANQTAVLKLILSDCTNGQIAKELYLAESTVKYHVKNILKATDCRDRNELIALYHDFGESGSF